MKELLKPKRREEREKFISALVDLIANEARRAIAEDSRLTVQEREQLLDAICRGPLGGWVLDTGALGSGVGMGGGFVLDLPEEKGFNVRLRIETRFHARWQLQPKNGREPDERTQMLLILLHDLLALGMGPGGLVGKDLAPGGFKVGWVTTRWITEPPSAVEIPWPAPPWSSFWEFELLARSWNRIVREARRAFREAGRREEEDLAYRLFYEWVALNTRILRGEAPIRTALSRKKPSAEEWEILGRILDELFSEYESKGASPWADNVRGWLIHLAALMAPETAFPIEGASVLVNGRWFRHVQETYASAVKQRRAAWFAHFISRGGEQIARELNEKQHLINQHFKLEEEEMGRASRLAGRFEQEGLLRQLLESSRERGGTLGARLERFLAGEEEQRGS